MEYNIFFDESNKLDAEKKYSYYGAYGVEQSKCVGIVADINKILRMTGKKSEYHFTEYNNDKDLTSYIYCLHHFIRTNLQINIFVVDNDIAFNFARNADITVTELRNLFYVKIPERLFYGLTRGLSDDYRTVEIVVDHSPDYERMRVYSKLKQQMNATFKTQFDVNEMTKILHIKRSSDTTKDVRTRMRYIQNVDLLHFSILC